MAVRRLALGEEPNDTNILDFLGGRGPVSEGGGSLAQTVDHPPTPTGPTPYTGPKGAGPFGLPVHGAQSGETARERAAFGQGRAVAAPPTPSVPSPFAGGVPGSNAGAATSGAGSTETPSFAPLPSPAAGLLTSARRSLYGGAGGLLGGGLGAQDTTSNQTSDPISSLIQMLQQRLGGGR